MPTSDVELKDWALEKIKSLNPKSVVDIGPGEGTYSNLARKYTRNARWMAIEAWAPYIPQFGLWGKYDHVVVSDVRHVNLMSVHHAPDLVIIGDVLEHMTRAEARAVLTNLKAWADHILVCVPLVHHDQGAHEGNWFEIHREHWTYDAMKRELSDGLVDSVEGEVLGYFHWSCYG